MVRKTGVSLVANALLVTLPAMIVSSGSVLTEFEFFLALAGLSLAVGLELRAQSPDRILAGANHQGDRSVMRFNLLHGLVLLATLQTFAVFAAIDATRPAFLSMALGTLILGVAAGLRCAAIRHLGPDFTDAFRPARQNVSRSGPYAWLRHPAELGLLLLPVGFATALGVANWLPTLMVPMIAASAFRIWHEERALITVCLTISSDQAR